MKIVAVTGCSRGKARAEMAAESLEEALESTEVGIDFEVHGESGPDTTLTEEQIEEAEAALIASDVEVDKERFSDIPVVTAGVQPAITSRNQLLGTVKKAVRTGEDIEYSEKNGAMDKIKGFFS